MSQDNQIIGFTKWIFKWSAIVIFGLIVMAIVIGGAVSGYEYVTYEMPKRQIEIVVGVLKPVTDPATLPSLEEMSEKEELEYLRKLDTQISSINVQLPDGTIIDNVPASMSDNDFVQKVHKVGLLLEEIEIKKALALAKAEARAALLQKLSGDWRSRAIPIGSDGKALSKAEGSGSIGKLCDDPFPIFVSFVNNSSRTVEYIDFDIIAKQSGRSTNLADYGDYSSDWILKPGDGGENCWRVNLKSGYEKLDLRDLEYEAKINYVRFLE